MVFLLLSYILNIKSKRGHFVRLDFCRGGPEETAAPVLSGFQKRRVSVRRWRISAGSGGPLCCLVTVVNK